jgi:hypothetical protein
MNADGTVDVIAGAGTGSAPRIVVLDSRSGVEQLSFFAFDPSFTGGVSVATGDVNGDGTPDIVVGAASRGAPHVKVFDGKSGAEIRSFFAYEETFTGGVRVASADVNGDFRSDIVTAPGRDGAPHVKVFSGTSNSEIRSTFAYDPSYRGGVSIAAADVDRDGFAEIITGSAADSSHVKMFNGKSGIEERSYYAFAPDLPTGVSVAAAIYNNDLVADIVVASSGASPRVRVQDGQTGNDITDLTPSELGFVGEVNVGIGPVQLSVSVAPPDPLPL